jgi:hypothetical protein
VIWSLPLVVLLFAIAWRRRVRPGSAARSTADAIGDHPA